MSTTATTDTVAFAGEVLHIEVQEHQREPLRCGRRRVVIAGGRRSGKSFVAQLRAVHVCLTRRDVQVLVVHTDRAKGREWLREAVDLLSRSELGRAVEVDEQSQTLRFPGSGSEVVVVAGTATSPRGFGRRVVLVIVEEASYQSPVLWTALRFVLLDNLAEVWLLGTPDCAFEHFFRQSFELGQGGDDDYASFSWATGLNSRIPREEIAKESARLTESERISQIDGGWAESEGSFFPRSLLRRQTAAVVLPEVGEIGSSIEVAGGLDYGGGVYDLSAAVIVARLPVSSLNSGDRKPRWVLIPKVWPLDATLPEVAVEVPTWGLYYRWLASETNGCGTSPSQALKASMVGSVRMQAFFATTNARKLAGYTALKWLCENDQLVLPPHPDLQRQLAGLKFERGLRGVTRIEASDPATHDDVADAAMLALGVHPDLTVELLRHAAPERWTRDAWVGALDCPVVETGGGLRVYEFPPLQSVAGPDVWVPSPAPGRDRIDGPGVAGSLKERSL